MPLWWIVHTVDGAPSVFVERGSGLVHARMKASIAGHAGEFIEAHALDDKMAKRVPEKMIGRSLDQREAELLLRKLG